MANMSGSTSKVENVESNYSIATIIIWESHVCFKWCENIINHTLIVQSNYMMATIWTSVKIFWWWWNISYIWSSIIVKLLCGILANVFEQMIHQILLIWSLSILLVSKWTKIAYNRTPFLNFYRLLIHIMH